jgi:alpha-L-rhamnosidase
VQARGVLTTGFIGVAHLLPALSETGRTDLAYKLLTNEKYPSWMFSIKKGATTIWERWNGILENGEFNDFGMNSFNHYSFGAVGEWMYGTVAGIELDETEPGYKHILIKPQPGGGLTSASAKLETIHGTVATDWKISGNTFTLSLTVPVNTTANVYLPFDKDVLERGATPRATADGSYAVGSGTYEFSAKIE